MSSATVRSAIVATFAVASAAAMPAATRAQMPPEALRQIEQKQIAAAQPGAAEAAQAAAAAKLLAEPMILTDAKLQAFLAAIADLKDLAKRTQGFSGNDPAEVKQMLKAMQTSGAATELVKKRGFADFNELQRVGYNAALARVVVEKGGKQALEVELKQAEAEQAKTIEQMRAQMTEEQLASLKSQMKVGEQMMAALRKVPEANIELARKYAGQMDALDRD